MLPSLDVVLDSSNAFVPRADARDVWVDRSGFVPPILSVEIEKENVHACLGAFQGISRSVINEDLCADRMTHLGFGSFM